MKRLIASVLALAMVGFGAVPSYAGLLVRDSELKEEMVTDGVETGAELLVQHLETLLQAVQDAQVAEPEEAEVAPPTSAEPAETPPEEAAPEEAEESPTTDQVVAEWVNTVFPNAGFLTRVGIRVRLGNKITEIVELIESLGGNATVSVDADGNLQVVGTIGPVAVEIDINVPRPAQGDPDPKKIDAAGITIDVDWGAVADGIVDVVNGIIALIDNLIDTVVDGIVDVIEGIGGLIDDLFGTPAAPN